MINVQRLSRYLVACCIVAAFTLFCVSPIRAQTITNAFGGLSDSSDEPIDIESDLLTIFPEDYATFSGNVKAVQGTTTLRAREIKVNYSDGDEEAVDDDPANAEDSNEQDPNDSDGEEPEAPAESSDANEDEDAENARVIEDPIDIASDWLLINDDEKYAQFKGNVRFVQGATRLRAKELTVSYAGNENLSVGAQMGSGGGAAQITKIEAVGDVRALFMPSGSVETTPSGVAQTETETSDGAPQPATTAGGEFGLASATNTAAGSAATNSPGGGAGERLAATAQPTAANGNTTGTAGQGPERDGNEGITKIEAKGDVVVTGEKNETTTSDWLVYDLPLQWVTIGGNVVLSQGQNVLKGDRLVINLETGESRFENIGTAASGRGRVRALFQPKDAGDSPKRNSGEGRAPAREAPQ